MLYLFRVSRCAAALKDGGSHSEWEVRYLGGRLWCYTAFSRAFLSRAGAGINIDVGSQQIPRKPIKGFIASVIVGRGRVEQDKFDIEPSPNSVDAGGFPPWAINSLVWSHPVLIVVAGSSPMAELGACSSYQNTQKQGSPVGGSLAVFLAEIIGDIQPERP
jgi:hypothetical protein